MDSTTTITELKALVKKMVDDRNWDQFHTPKDLAMSISVEASELLEHFLWNKPEGHPITSVNRADIEAEVADVAIGILLFCSKAQIDLADAIVNKLKLIDQKYPVAKCYGVSKKYDQL
ncbi:MAG: nucleotide pyrophosphohydrolase [Candidatus Dependentiae bacterium]|nr:nucleotide pyrophosphohydrolase [Candidatus Dependentiae bacterium]